MRTVDLFAGCGGFSLGFQKAGFQLVAAFDNWLPAIEVYRNNFNHPIFELDLSQENSYQIIANFKPEIIIGGPPCQDFSSAGKRNEHLERANLTISFAQIVTQIKPEWFVMENVERITHTQILKDILSLFKKHNYGLTSQVINASYCGVPQSRKRYFLIGQLGGKDKKLADYLQKNQSQKPLTVFEYLGHNLDIEFYYRHPRSYQRRGIFSIYEPSPTIRGVNRPIPKNYQKHNGDVSDINENIRPLTTIERSYIQTFPPDFKFQGTKSNLEQMIGNAVPVNLAMYIGQCILASINNHNYPQDNVIKHDNLCTYQQLSLF